MADDTVRADSADGRRFTFAGAGAQALRPGDVVVLSAGPERIVGQVTDAAHAHAEGRGQVLGAIGDDRLDRAPRPPFASVGVAPAGPAELRLLQVSSDASLPVGTWTSGATGEVARLRAQGFGRHTFLCGQSGSGKTYALGVLLEQVRLQTGLRIVVLDPNADYVRMNEVRADAPDDVAAAWRARGPVTVLGSDASGAEPLRLRFATMPRAAQAAVLRLDPLRDRGEYHLFVRHAGDGAEKGLGGGRRPALRGVRRRAGPRPAHREPRAPRLGGLGARPGVGGGGGGRGCVDDRARPQWLQGPARVHGRLPRSRRAASGHDAPTAPRPCSSSTRPTTCVPRSRRGPSRRPSSTGSCRSRPRGASTASGCSCRPSGPPSCTRRCSRSATTSC